MALSPAARPIIYRRSRFTAAMRRITDIIIASIVLVIAAPVLVAACIAIALEDGFPLVFKQKRVGRFERQFTIYKLRTMRKADCADRLSPRTGRDSRITSVGLILRKLSIDELPQLLNVLRGEMSIVGPRPEMPFVVARYERWQSLRHLATPGLTCIWQTTCRKTVPLERPEATKLDLDYLERASPALDSRLMIRTIASVLFSKGAY